MQVTISTQPITKRRNAWFKTKTRVYVHPVNETIFENLVNRRSRPLNTYREALRKGLSELGVDISKVDYKWSQKAGCSCGCSPGFIVDGWDPAIANKNVWVCIEAV